MCLDIRWLSTWYCMQCLSEEGWRWLSKIWIWTHKRHVMSHPHVWTLKGFEVSNIFHLPNFQNLKFLQQKSGIYDLEENYPNALARLTVLLTLDHWSMGYVKPQLWGFYCEYHGRKWTWLCLHCVSSSSWGNLSDWCWMIDSTWGNGEDVQETTAQLDFSTDLLSHSYQRGWNNFCYEKFSPSLFTECVTLSC